MLSLWPAGLPSNGKGTIDWAGGLIDWNSQYMQNGYYYAMVKDVSVQCYDPPSGAQESGSKSYSYTDYTGTNSSVKISDNVVVLKSFYATGDNPSYDPNGSASASSSKTASGKAEATSASVETIPGMSGVGNQGANDANPVASGSDSSGASGTAGSSGSSSTGSSGFSQGNSGGSTGGAAEMKGKALGGSLFAVWVGVFALLIL